MKKSFRLIALLTIVLTLVACLVACNIEDNTEVPSKIVVTFDSNGGSNVPAITVSKDGTLKLPTNPTKEGYTFGGWYLDKATTNAFKNDDKIPESITVYAKWTEKAKYAVTFVGGDGATGTAPSMESQFEGASITLPANTFIKANHTFAGWKVGADTYQPTDSYEVGTQAVTFTAKWTENAKYAVTFVGGAGTTGTAPTMASQFEGASITLPANTFSAVNHTFAGWYDGANIYQVGAKYTMTASAVTFTATWTVNAKYTVTFAGGEGATGTAPSMESQFEGASITLPANTFTKANHTFIGWTDGTNAFQPSASYVIGTQNVTFTANWQEDGKYSVAFAGGEGATGTAPTATSQYEGASITLPANMFTKANHTFAGWTVGADTYQPNDSYEVGTQNVIFTAKWTENAKYAVTFVGGEGATGTAPTMASQYEGAKINLPTNTFSAVNHTFAGWYDGTRIYQVGAEYTMTAAAVTFTATWTVNAKYTVTFLGGDGATGTAPTMESQFEGASITLPANTFTKENHTFAGWKIGADTYQAGASYTIGAANVTFTAKWQSNGEESFGAIINHEDAQKEDLLALDASQITSIKEDLRIAYFHTSHGNQIIEGNYAINYLFGNDRSKDFSDAIVYDSYGEGMYVDAGQKASAVEDLGPDIGSLVTATKSFFGDAGQNGDLLFEAGKDLDVNVVIWSWCGELSVFSEERVQQYLDDLNELENYYNGVNNPKKIVFVYMTGHLYNERYYPRRTDDTKENNTRNNALIREYCNNNNKILFDFEDIESYNPDGEYFGDKCNDESLYWNGAVAEYWARDWERENTENEDWVSLNTLTSSTPAPNFDGFRPLTIFSHVEYSIIVLSKAYAFWGLLNHLTTVV